MKILIDWRSIHGTSWTRGIGEFSRNLILALIKEGHEVSLLALPSQDTSLMQAWGCGRYDEAINYDVLHIIDPMSIIVGLDSPFSLGKMAKLTTSTFYDTIPADFNLWSDWPEIVKDQYKARLVALSKIDCVFPISEVAEVMLNNWVEGAETHVAGIGIDRVEDFDNQIKKPIDIGKEQMFDQLIERPFILTVGGCEPHKNINLVSEAFMSIKALAPDTIWIVVGKQSDYHKRIPILPGMYFLAHVSRANLEKLYQKTKALFYPSLSEGFGLPAYEAAALGANVLCGDFYSAKPLQTLGLQLLEPIPSVYVSSFLEILKGDESYRLNEENISLLKGMFSWSKVAKRMGQVWESKLSKANSQNTLKTMGLNLSV